MKRKTCLLRFGAILRKNTGGYVLYLDLNHYSWFFKGAKFRLMTPFVQMFFSADSAKVLERKITKTLRIC